MKEIGQKLKLKREENGVSVEEAASDLKLRPSQIISIEEGKKDDFDDIVYLKEFMSDYAKYLGLDGEKIVDEFNEYMFDFTSKISLDAINQARKEEVTKVSSPYTVSNEKKKIPLFLIIIVVITILGVIAVIFINGSKDDEVIDNTITYKIGGKNLLGGN